VFVREGGGWALEFWILLLLGGWVVEEELVITPVFSKAIKTQNKSLGGGIILLDILKIKYIICQIIKIAIKGYILFIVYLIIKVI